MVEIINKFIGVMDFTLVKYIELLEVFRANHHRLYCFNDYLSASNHVTNKLNVILRHDVDHLPCNALKMAQIENEFDLKSTYYFRVNKDVFKEEIIKQIAELGHEIGYHYEDLDLAVKQQKAYSKKINSKDELIDFAMELFLKNLEKLRRIAPVNTICMHGSPLSKYDNRMLWDKYDYRDYGIIGEPYFDLDFSKIAYYTDTGRSWAGDSVSVRDKVKQSNHGSEAQIETIKFPKYKSTFEMIKAIEKGSFPKQAMLTIHPQRWHDQAWPWVKELVWQNVKNVGKYALIKYKK